MMLVDGIGSCHTLKKYMGKQWQQWLTIFWGSKITADDDCSHEIKRCLLLQGVMEGKL